MWQRQIHSLAPSPARASTSPPAAGRGRCTRPSPPRQLARVHLVVARARCPTAPSREVLGRALQRVVHELRRVEELLAPVDDLPLAVQPDVLHQRDERVEDLGDAAAERGRRQVDDARALQRLGELADLLDQRPADDVRVVGEGLLADGDGLEHRSAEAIATGVVARSARGARRARTSTVAALAVADDLERHRLRPAVAAAAPGRGRSRSRTGVSVDLRDDVAARRGTGAPGSAPRRSPASQPGVVGRAVLDDLLDPRARARCRGRSARRAAGRRAVVATPR